MRIWMREHLLSGAGNVVYGSIVTLALVIVLDFEDATAGAAALSIGAAVSGVAAAEAYADFLEGMLRRHRTLRPREWGEILEGVVLHMLAALLPVTFLVLAATGAMKLGTAYAVAELTGVAILGLFGFGAYRLAGVPVARSVLAGLALTGVGLVLVLLKLLGDH